MPKFSDDQVQLALTVISTDYWALSCSTCREYGHSAFSCPYLEINQRLYFAYRYYLYQVKSNPTMARWLEDLQTARDVGERFMEPRPFDLSRGGRAGVHGLSLGGYQGDTLGNGGWAPGGRGRSMYPSDRRGVFVVSDEDVSTEDGSAESDEGTAEADEREYNLRV